MATKLKNIRSLGRYRNKESGAEVNVKKGDVVGRGTVLYFYLYRNARITIPEAEFRSQYIRIEK